MRRDNPPMTTSHRFILILISILTATFSAGFFIEMIPAESRDAAALPPSGARLVIDCAGRHLQVSAHGTEERAAHRLENAVSEATAVIAAGFLPRLTRGGADASEAEVLIYAISRRADPSLTRTAVARRLGSALWIFGTNREGETVVRASGGAYLPIEYVTASCLHGTPEVIATHASSAIRSVEELATALAATEAEELVFSILDEWDGIEGGWDAVKEFLQREAGSGSVANLRSNLRIYEQELLRRETAAVVDTDCDYDIAIDSTEECRGPMAIVQAVRRTRTAVLEAMRVGRVTPGATSPSGASP